MPKTVLIVDDAKDVADLIAMTVELKGFRTLKAYDGRTGVLMALQQRPDLVLMDIRMPEIDGYEATRRILADPNTSAIPVVAISAHLEGNWRQRAQQAGCVDCLPKPLDFKALESVLARLLGG